MEKGVYRFQVRSYECGPDGRSTLMTIADFLQEAASLHAATLGFGKDDFAAMGENVTWVLTRLKVKMRRYPTWGEEVTVETFPRGGRRIVAWRDFELKGAGGETLGLATSEWMVIDLSTRRLQPVPERVLAACEPAFTPVLGLEPFAKFRFPSAGGDRGAAAFTAMKSQIDLNGHVNNVHYLGWMLEPCESRCPVEVEVVFRSETFAGDEVRVETVSADGWLYHRVTAPDGAEHIVARTQPIG